MREGWLRYPRNRPRLICQSRVMAMAMAERLSLGVARQSLPSERGKRDYHSRAPLNALSPKRWVIQLSYWPTNSWLQAASDACEHLQRATGD